MFAFLADFFRDPDGSSSMTRLVAFVLAVDASTVVGFICAVAIKGAAATVLAALTGVVTALVASGAVALLSRTKTIAPPPAAAAAVLVEEAGDA